MRTIAGGRDRMARRRRPTPPAPSPLAVAKQKRMNASTGNRTRNCTFATCRDVYFTMEVVLLH